MMKNANLKLRVLLPLFVMGSVALSVFIIGDLINENNHIRKNFSHNLDYLDNYYQTALKERTEKLKTALEIITHNPRFRAGLKTRNRKALLSAALPLFKRLKSHENITHFYFHDSHGVNILRVHQPLQYGDTIKRFTMLNAENTGKTAAGIELGPLGTFTLRAVAPVREHKQLIGYIELGEEFEDILEDISSIYGLKLYAAIDKQYLKRDNWQDGMRLLGHKPDWDRFPNNVIVFQSTQVLPPLLDHSQSSPKHAGAETHIDKLTWRGQKYEAGFVPLIDASNREVGRLLVMQDFTKNANQNYISLFTNIAIVIVLGGLLLGFLYFMLDQIERNFNLKWKSLQSASNGVVQQLSVVKLVTILLIAIFISEYLVMQALPENMPGHWSALIDASVLVMMLYPLLYLVLIHPYNRQIHLRAQAESGNAMLGRILDHSKNEIYMFDTEELHFLDVSQGACDNLGYTQEEMKQLTPLDLKEDYTKVQFLALIEPLNNGIKQQLIFETNHRRKDGTHYPVEVHLELFNNNSTLLYVAIIEDISERKRHIAELEHKALYDDLTELPNRNLLMDRLEHDVKVARRNASPLSVMLIDIMRLQEINDIMGHADGDLVLQQVAQRLQTILRESDTIARIGGDEFVAVLPNAGCEHMEVIAKKILSASEELIYVREVPLEVEVAVGIAAFPDHGDTPGILLQRADVAMRIAKNETSGFYLYTPEDDPYSVRQLKLHAELRRAINEKTLTLYYQPKLQVSSGKVISVEALARWPHPEGMIPPNDFIPMVEQTGLIRPFTQWVLEEAVSQSCLWQKLGFNLSIAVNLSTRNLLDPVLADYLGELLDLYKLDPSALILEITESAVMNRAEKALKILTTLSDMGFKLSIDDFGTGYSSLAYLKRLPVNELKIDRSFVINMCDDKNDAKIVRSTIELAHNMGLKVVAEGIENQEQLDMLIELGIDYGQGYFIAEPMPNDSLADWLSGSHSFISNKTQGKTA